MQPHELTLRALLFEGKDGMIQAQLLELDIAVRASSMNGVLEAFRHAIIVLYEAAQKVGVTPFVNTLRAPEEFQGKWAKGGGNTAPAGHFTLPAEVAVALAIALRADRPIADISVLKLRSAA